MDSSPPLLLLLLLFVVVDDDDDDELRPAKSDSRRSTGGLGFTVPQARAAITAAGSFRRVSTTPAGSLALGIPDSAAIAALPVLAPFLSFAAAPLEANAGNVTSHGRSTSEGGASAAAPGAQAGTQAALARAFSHELGPSATRDPPGWPEGKYLYCNQKCEYGDD